MPKITVKNIVNCFGTEELESICRAIADTDSGLTGSEIAYTLKQARIPDVDSKNTKWKRLFNAFIAEQNKQKYGNHVVSFLHHAMNPAKHVQIKDWYVSKRKEINLALAFNGLSLGEDGKIRRVKIAKTIAEAEQRADELRGKLQDRNVHLDILKFCKAELLTDNYFHAVLEASKSIANKIRKITGLTSDGAILVQEAFGFGKENKPLLAINTLNNDTEKGEQKGFTNLLIGLFGTFRNPTAHAEKIYWELDKEDALDILSLISLVHRKIDKAKKPA
jgi:uncharacterized protein (TIGR02391 family)